ncbi:MAG: amino acid adenylation domain-containing protein [Thermoanaerobaculia bacterium]
MNATRLLRDLHRAGVRLWIEGERLRYRGPESALTVDVRERMKRHKAELLALIRQPPDADGPRPVDRDGELPLSYNQQQLWLLAQLDPHSPAYNEGGGIRLRGELDFAALTAAITEIARRHEVLRTSFAAVEGRPRQLIAPELTVPIPQVDLGRLDATRQQAELGRWTTARARLPFDLGRAPLMRLTLVRLAAGDHVLAATLHHLIHDGESMKTFAGEMIRLYEAFSNRRPSPLAELEIQYADYAVWQRQRLRGELLAAEIDYWRRELAGSEPALDLPLDHPRPPVPSFRGGREPIALPPELSSALRQLARDQQVTLYLVLLTAFFALLHRYCGQDRINLGVPRSGRFRARVSELLGFVVNTQVLSVETGGNPSFRQLLARVRERVLGAEAHPDLPFELLVRELEAQRDPSLHPLFQVMFAYQEDPTRGIRLPGLELSFLEIATGVAKFDLDVSLEDRGEQVAGFMEYRSELFEPETVRRILDHFQRLLEGIAQDPEQSLGELALLSPEERRQLLAPEAEEVAVAPPALLHQRCRLQAEATPTRTALVTADRQLTYRQLDQAADRLARHFIARGLEPGQRVAVMLDDPLLQAPALLAVLKAGGVFVCPDRGSPPARLAAILRQAKPRLLVTESTLAAELASGFAERADAGLPELVELDLRWQELTAESAPAAPPEVTVAPSDPCYVAYTSGSTGEPKGIVQCHAHFCQFLDWQSEQFAMRAPNRIAQCSALGYDAAYCEIFGALAFGATLCVPTAEEKADPRTLLAWLRRHRITLLQTVPSFGRQLLRTMELAADGAPLGELVPELETVMLAGEVLPPDLAEDWLRHFGPRPALYNLYGPSETVLATWYPVCEVDRRSTSIPVGFPIPGRQILVLDRHQQLCPPGVKGEIFVRSRYLTLGYFERPQETARAFLENPLDDDRPEPVYRTGDLGRWLPGGRLEFCGRVDQQVKIRGMRVELGEVESALARHPAVEQCAAVIHDYGPGDRRLVAYLVAAAEEPAVQDLRRHLRELVPEHMVPAVFVPLESLPRTATGKLDRGVLARPALTRQDQVSRFVAPRSALEARVAELWREQLKLDRVGVDDDFFSLGGNSLSAVQLSYRISESSGVELSLRDFFEAPTVAQLAAMIDRRGADSRAWGDTVDRLLSTVQKLSDHEVEELLAREEN